MKRQRALQKLRAFLELRPTTIRLKVNPHSLIKLHDGGGAKERSASAFPTRRPLLRLVTKSGSSYGIQLGFVSLRDEIVSLDRRSMPVLSYRRMFIQPALSSLLNTKSSPILSGVYHSRKGDLSTSG